MRAFKTAIGSLDYTDFKNDYKDFFLIFGAFHVCVITHNRCNQKISELFEKSLNKGGSFNENMSKMSNKKSRLKQLLQKMWFSALRFLISG